MRFIIPSFAMNNQHVTQTIRQGLLNETEHHFAALFHRLAQKIQARLCLLYTSDTNLFDFKGITHGSEVVNGGDLAFDREEIPLQPAGWQPEEDENQLDLSLIHI